MTTLDYEYALRLWYYAVPRSKNFELADDATKRHMIDALPLPGDDCSLRLRFWLLEGHSLANCPSEDETPPEIDMGDLPQYDTDTSDEGWIYFS